MASPQQSVQHPAETMGREGSEIDHNGVEAIDSGCKSNDESSENIHKGSQSNADGLESKDYFGDSSDEGGSLLEYKVEHSLKVEESKPRDEGDLGFARVAAKMIAEMSQFGIETIEKNRDQVYMEGRDINMIHAKFRACLETAKETLHMLVEKEAAASYHPLMVDFDDL